MRLPFSEAQFLDVFAAYNTALWPAVLVLWGTTFAGLLSLARQRRGGRLLSGILALLWAWGGVVYHLLYFTSINPTARFFGGLFALQAIGFLWLGVFREQLRFSLEKSARHILGGILMVYAMLYPFLVIATGHTYPRSPTFGVPCPTALVTAGLLLTMLPQVSRWLLIIPIAWCVVGGTAALTLGMQADWMLFVAALLLIVRVAAPRVLA